MSTKKFHLPSKLNLYSYIGWISNLQGRLFFHLFDPYGFRYDKTIGEIFFFKDRNSNLFFWSGLIDFRDSSKNYSYKELRCFFIAQKNTSERGEKLNGKFFIVLEELDEEKVKVKDIYKLTTEKNENYDSYLQKIQEFKYFLEFNIEILQNGIIKITSIINNDKFDFNDKRTEKYFFLNIFLLIKSLFHKDRFHHKRNEHINLVVESKDEVEALKKFVYFIQRYIAEERKKFDNNIINYNLVGITNYLITLLNIIKNYDEEFYKAKITMINHLKSALKDEKKDDSKIKNLISSAAISSLSLVGVYKILEINTIKDEDIEIKKQILQSLFPSFIEGFIIILFIFVVYDFVKTRAIPFSLSNNPFFKTIVNVYNLVCGFLIKNTKPTIGTNPFNKKIIPYLRRNKIRNLNIKIYEKDK